ALALAVRHEILSRNPMDHVSRLRRPVRTPDVYSWEEIAAIRSGIRTWEQREVTAGPRPDGQLGQIVEVLLGTSARIGEVLAIRLGGSRPRRADPCSEDLRHDHQQEGGAHASAGSSENGPFGAPSRPSKLHAPRSPGEVAADPVHPP